MKKPASTKWFLLILVLLTVCIAAVYLTTRTQVPEKTIMVEFHGETVYLDISTLPMVEIKGTLVNGKGEKREIEAEGCLLSVVLEKALGDFSGSSKVTVTAADEFSAEVFAEEWEQPDQVYLLLDESAVQLVVFGDSNSKRNVRNVERILVE